MAFDYTSTYLLLMASRQKIPAKINKNKTMRNMTFFRLRYQTWSKENANPKLYCDYLMARKSYSLKNSWKLYGAHVDNE